MNDLFDEPIPRFPMLGVLALLLVVEIVGFAWWVAA